MRLSRKVTVIPDNYLLKCAAEKTLDFMYTLDLTGAAAAGKIIKDVRSAYLHFILECMLDQTKQSEFFLCGVTGNDCANELTALVPHTAKTGTGLITRIRAALPHRFFMATDCFQKISPLNQLPGHWIDSIQISQARTPKSLEKFKKLVRDNKLSRINDQLDTQFDTQKLILSC